MRRGGAAHGCPRHRPADWHADADDCVSGSCRRGVGQRRPHSERLAAEAVAETMPAALAQTTFKLAVPFAVEPTGDRRCPRPPPLNWLRTSQGAFSWPSSNGGCCSVATACTALIAVAPCRPLTDPHLRRTEVGRGKNSSQAANERRNSSLSTTTKPTKMP